MELIGVVDVKGGQAVHARGGTRARYVPIGAFGGTPIHGEPLALARGYIDQSGVSAIYAADLDAIDGGHPSDAMVRTLAGVAPLWLDAGITSADHAQHVIECGAARAIVGLETLSSFERLADIRAAIGHERLAFSLDLRAGAPLLARDAAHHGDAYELAARAADAGVTTLIVIDLARVGNANGPQLELLSRVREAAPGARLFAGGGIRGLADLRRLADVGCNGALVASALLDGTLSAADVGIARRLERHGSVTR